MEKIRDLLDSYHTKVRLGLVQVFTGIEVFVCHLWHDTLDGSCA